MPRALAAVAAASALAAGCGDDEPRAESASDQLAPPPAGYRYAPAPDQAGQRAFEKKVASDLDADQVEVRNVLKGSRFVAGVVVARTTRAPNGYEVAEKVAPGGTAPVPVEVAGKSALRTIGASGSAGINLIDTFGSFIVVVTAADIRTANRVAAPLLR